MGPKSTDKCPCNRHTEREMDTNQGEGHVKTKAEVGVMQPQGRLLATRSWKKQERILP